MKKVYSILLLMSFSLLLSAQETTHKVSVMNIEVPVRIFEKDRFIDNLTIEDFEVYEDGIPQKIEAVYLVNKTEILREEGTRYDPRLSRKFVLVFEMTDYLKGLDETLDYFVNHVLVSGDSLGITTPMHTLEFSSMDLEMMSREELGNLLKDRVKKSLELSGREYKELIRELDNQMQEYDPDYIKEDKPGGLIGKEFIAIHNLLKQLDEMRRVYQKDLLSLADYMKNLEGQKHVLLFFQPILVPHFEDPELKLDKAIKKEQFDIDEIKMAFAGSLTSFHSLFIPTSSLHFIDMQRRRFKGTEFHDQGDEIYIAFTEMAEATGGFIERSENVKYLMEKATDMADHYYLVYYSPKDYKKDGQFHEIRISIKGREYKTSHPAGYIAD